MKKRLLSILLVATMLLAMIPAMAFVTSALTVANWDAETIVLITADDFLEFRNKIRTKADAGNGYAFQGQTILLCTDINFGSIPSSNGFDSRSFAGTFDGQGHTLTGTIAQGGYQGALFGNVAAGHPGAVIKNVYLKDITVTGGHRIAPFFGGVYGGTVTFENVYVKGTVSSTASSTGQESGGFVGRVQSSTVNFKNCVFEGTVTNNAGAGAFVGCLMDSAATVNFENCLNLATNNMVAEKVSGTTPVESYVKCLNYNSQKDAVGSGADAAAWLTANGYTDWSVMNEGAPVPTSIKKAFYSAELIDWNANVISLETSVEFAAFYNKLTAGETFEGQTVVLGADINMATHKLTPYEDSSTGFLGTFDGQYHTLSNFTLTHYVAPYSGALFGAVAQGKSATIRNLGVENAVTTHYAFSGLLYGNVLGTIAFENVYCNANITNASGSPVGGFVGRMNLAGVSVSFENCVFDGSMSCKDYLYSPFVGVIETAADGVLSFTNCVIDGNFLRNGSEWLGAGKFVCQNGTKSNNVVTPGPTTITYTNCIQYNDYYQTTDPASSKVACPELIGIGEGFTATTPAGFTARNTSYPVPTTLLPFFASEVNGARGETGVTGYYAYQDTAAKDSVRFVGLVNGESTEIKAVGFEVVVIRNNGNVWTNVADGNAPYIQNVYTSILENGAPKTAEACGGDYLFVYAVNGMVANMGNVTFAVKTFSVDTNGVKTYEDMYILDYDTTLAA